MEQGQKFQIATFSYNAVKINLRNGFISFSRSLRSASLGVPISDPADMKLLDDP